MKEKENVEIRGGYRIYLRSFVLINKVSYFIPYIYCYCPFLFAPIAFFW